ncbi:hypothetical protein NQZ79_g7998 [Umbelopsis isabellina]|nr:hypothetical protein NQZ79_g7998 [Umbelopsis isabellina]
MADNRCPVCLQQIPEHASTPDCLQCSVCGQWHHSNCVDMTSQQCESINSFHCQNCATEQDSTIHKQPIRKSDRQHTKLNYADMNEGLTGDEKIWEKIINSKEFATDPFKRYRGSDFSIDTIRENGLDQPIVFEQPDDLDMTMPSPDITVRDIADLIGGDQHVDVIDVATQAEQPGWTMNRWAEYFHNQDRDRIRNVISLEISGTKFAEPIRRPKIVRDIDWIDNVWPTELKVKEYPKVQLYCLMGTKNSYTDFHIDFGGTSVFYHILSGSKIFFFIPPTSVNLRKYEKWSSSPDQPTIFLGDEVKECYKVHIKAGNTMLIPSGWIHSVFTPEDSIVIGGNFLQGFGIEKQLNVYDLEERTNVPQKFRFPYFMRMNWFAAQKYQNLLQGKQQHLAHHLSTQTATINTGVNTENSSDVSTLELRGLRKLANYLLSETTFLDPKSGNPEKRRQVKQDIPSSIADPVELAQSLLKQVTELLGPAEQADPEPKQGIKVKLKVKPAPTPRLKLKVKQPKGRVKKEDADFVYDDNQYFDEEIDETSLLAEDDDDDYVQGAGEAKPGNKKKVTPVKRKKGTKAYKDDSSDDGLGTGTVKSKRVNTKAIGNNAADKKTKGGSVKQRLLNRIKKK